MNEKAQNKTKLPPGQAHNLVMLVDYADGAIVSRTIAENQSGTITVFAFDDGQNLSEHTAPFDALVQVLDGKAEYIIGGKGVEVSAGEIILMPANIPHAVNSKGRFKMLLIILRSKNTK